MIFRLKGCNVCEIVPPHGWDRVFNLRLKILVLHFCFWDGNIQIYEARLSLMRSWDNFEKGCVLVMDFMIMNIVFINLESTVK